MHTSRPALPAPHRPAGPDSSTGPLEWQLTTLAGADLTDPASFSQPSVMLTPTVTSAFDLAVRRAGGQRRRPGRYIAPAGTGTAVIAAAARVAGPAAVHDSLPDGPVNGVTLAAVLATRGPDDSATLVVATHPHPWRPDPLHHAAVLPLLGLFDQWPAGRRSPTGKALRAGDAIALIRTLAAVPFTDPGDGTLAALDRLASRHVAAWASAAAPGRAVLSVGRQVPSRIRHAVGGTFAARANPFTGPSRMATVDIGTIRPLLDRDDVTIDPALADLVALTTAPPHRDRRLRPLQQVAVGRHLATNRGIVNALPTGAGKTVCALVGCQQRSVAADPDGPYVAVVVAETSTVAQWVEEAGRWWPEATVTTITSKGDDDILTDLPVPGAQLMVTTYGNLSRLERDPRWVALPVADVIADEARGVMRPGTATHRAMGTLRGRADVAVALTATPQQAGPAAMSQLVAWVRGTGTGPAPISVAHVVAAAGPILLTGTDATDDELPDVTITHDVLVPTDAERAVSDTVRATLVEADGTSSWLAAITAAKAVTAGPDALRAARGARTRPLANRVGDAATVRTWAVDLAAAEADAGRQVVVATTSPATANQVVTMLEGRDVTVGAVTGPTPADARAETMGRFRDGTVAVVVVTAAAERGVNLQAADVLICADVPWSAGRLVQRIGRIRRIGSAAEAVEVRIATLAGCIDTVVADAVVAHARQVLDVGPAAGEGPTVAELARSLTANPPRP